MLITVLFCVHLAQMGKREIEKAQAYTEREKEYVRKLLACDRSLDAAGSELERFLANRTLNGVQRMLKTVVVSRRAIDILAAAELERAAPEGKRTSEAIRDHAARLHSIVNAMIDDFNEPPWDRKTLVDEDTVAAMAETRRLRADLNERLNMELRHVENWRDQSLFFYEKLETQLVYFFVLATCLMMAVFALSGYVLRRYLGLLSTGAHEIALGNLEYRFDDETRDLVGKVMRDFDAMAGRLSAQNEALLNANKELALKAAELEEAHRHKDRFLANMSHELRTPLNSIIGFSELIIRSANKEKSSKSAGFATKVLAAAEHLLELISDLLDVAKADAGVLELAPVEMNLPTEVESVVTMLKPIADNQKIELKLETPKTPVLLKADRRLLKQVLINLLNNAIKFTKSGSVTVSISSDGKHAEIAVADTGIGIEKNEIGKIFKDFHRVEQGLTSNYDGAGLGLTLSKRIVELHGGTISVESEFGKGSVFTIRLPLVPKRKRRRK